MATGENTTKVLVTGFGVGALLYVASPISVTNTCSAIFGHYQEPVLRDRLPPPTDPSLREPEVVPKLIADHDPDIMVHMGLAVERDYFAVESSALKEGYHEIPDIARRVFTRAENKAQFGKSAASLSTDLPLDEVVDSWKDSVAQARLRLPTSFSTFPASGAGKARGSGKNGTKGNKEKEEQREVDVRLSDDVGTYVCGFMYYLSLLEMGKKGKRRNTVFFHVPRLGTEDVVDIGVKVTESLMQALVDAITNKGT
ncbi:peptidase C15- pyroglutamyl peptidase I-like protein [Apiospora aurea]|uniref:Peptidase C15- pyroglutamyl peptidase I-like protein n=1 Tax=Apiospora aurea TaxID=335848 RepID=A0ABR1PY28_9PEZI